MLAKHVNDDVPSFFVVDVDDECGDGIVRQGHKRGVGEWFLRLWFLPSRARSGHSCRKEKDEGRCALEER